MFEGISKEMMKVFEHSLDSKAILDLSPVYLFSLDGVSDEYITENLKELLIDFEKKEIFLANNDDIIYLNQEYGTASYEITENLGLSNECGKFKKTLDQWLTEINLKCYVSQGIVLIKINETEGISSKSVWWKRLIANINRFKKDYLFMIQTDTENFDKVYDFINSEIFCQKLVIESPNSEKYFDIFIRNLDKYKLSLDSQGRKKLKKIILANIDSLDTKRFIKWEQEIIWKYMVNFDGESKKEEFMWYERQNTEENDVLRTVLPCEYINDDGLKETTSSGKELTRLGF